MMDTLKNKYACRVKQDVLKGSLLCVSALMREYIDGFLDTCIHLLSLPLSASFREHELVTIKPLIEHYVKDITEKEKDFLLEA